MEETEEWSGVYEFVEDTLVDSFLKLARVNLLTGEFRFMKQDKALLEEGLEGITNIYSFIKKQVESQIVLSEYAEDYLRFSDPQYVQARVFGGERRIIQSYTRKSGERYRWVTFGIISPENCGPENPWAVFCWREADTDTITMVDALSTLTVIYYKILKINLTRDSFETVKVDKKEREQFVSRLSRISDWWRSFEERGNVYEEDEEVYRQFTDMEALREHFREDPSRISCRYRRRIGEDYRWVQMDLVPSAEYTDTNQTLILYVKDVHEEYLMEQRARQELVDSYNRDALTLLYNRHKYNEDLEELHKGESARLTCLYVDVNGLHELNNLLGHEKGDNMLCSVADALRKYFPEERIYRIGGDEFVMLSTRLSKRSVEHILSEVRNDLRNDGYEISAGVESGLRELAVYKIIGAAELAMRADKEQYYKQNGGRRKNRTANEELENLLTEKQDAESFLKIIASKFAGVYFVDLRLDTLRHIFIPKYFLELLEKTDFCYSQALQLYVDKFVKWEYHQYFNRALDYRYLEERLKNEGAVQFAYQKVDGSWMNLRIMDLDSGKEKRETLWIYSDDTKNLFE